MTNIIRTKNLNCNNFTNLLNDNMVLQKLELDIYIDELVDKFDLQKYKILNCVDEEGYGFYKVNKDFIKEVIEIYNNRIKQNFQNLFNSCKEEKLETVKAHIYQKFAFLSQNYLVDFKDENKLTDIWLIEYSIFNVVNFYKNIQDDEIILLEIN